MASSASFTSPDTPRDHAVWGIVGTNAAVALGAVVGGGGLLLLLWPYWLQSVIIGIFARRRILKLQRYSTEGFKINNRSVAPTRATARQTAWFFLFHYGGFHFAYAVFLLAFTTSGAATGFVPVTNANTGVVHQMAVGTWGVLDTVWLAALGVGFWQSHGASHREHVEADLAGTPKIGTLMFVPYLRIVPMHLTIILGAVLGAGGGVLLFATLKTISDVVMHKVEHRMLRRGAAAAVT